MAVIKYNFSLKLTSVGILKPPNHIKDLSINNKHLTVFGNSDDNFRGIWTEVEK